MWLMSQARKHSSEYLDQCCESYGQEALPALSPISPCLLFTALLINSQALRFIGTLLFGTLPAV